MNVDKQAKIDIENVLKLLRRAKFDDLQGIEALAMARAYAWLESLLIEKPAPVPTIVEDPVIQQQECKPFVKGKKKSG